MMTDRHVVNDSLKLLLEKWRNDCLPLIIDNFKSIPIEIQAKLGEINHFKCNLHVLVNLGTQAENALKQWEKSVVIAESSSNFIKGSYNFSTNAPDFIRASTKLCVPGADQKSGYGLLFKSYLDSLNPPVTLEMSTFHGHRINVLFSMGAAVFYHRHHISDFINSYFLSCTGQNNLVTCVSNYLNNNVYIAGCRALGIVDKLLTGPLWRQIESTKHILDLNQVWYTCLNNLQIFSEDSSELLEGKSIYPNFTNNNHIYDALFNVDDEELNMLTIEALQILCTNFLIIIHRQLGDYLPGGKFHQDSANFSELKKQSSCVASTNIVSERDFANFDRRGYFENSATKK
jgi:E1A/CREB-binding protein